MPTYVYETIPQHEGEQPVRFEMRQSMKDVPLSSHPETGKPVRRVPIGGTGSWVPEVAQRLRGRVAAVVQAVAVINRPQREASG